MTDTKTPANTFQRKKASFGRLISGVDKVFFLTSLSMAKPDCAASSCERESISYSKFCGQHTNNRVLRSTINKLKDNSLTDVYWNEIELKKITFKKKHFAAGHFSNIDLYEVQFIDCGFSDCSFEHVVFTDTLFENCELEKCVFTDVTFQESRFLECKMLDSGFNEVNFADESAFDCCDLDSCDFSGGIFSETGMIRDTRFYNNNFTQISISRSAFKDCQFIESAFSKSSLYDSSFSNCQFNTITHDFKLSGPPMLCHFIGSVFINTNLPRTFNTWNNLKLSPFRFYIRLINKLLKDNHSNHLKELSLALQKLEDVKQINAESLRVDVKALFTRLAQGAAHAGNYESIGEILSAYGRIPEKFRAQSGFFLPPADNDGGIGPGQGKLYIRMALDQWNVSRVAALLALMTQMEEVLPEGNPQVIQVIEKGSFIIEILGSLNRCLPISKASSTLKSPVTNCA